jgi:drug/metabolite transporter (DMT)-like permease
MGPSNVRAHVALVVVSTIWGLSYLFTKIALQDMGPFELATVRTLIAGALFFPVFLAEWRSLPLRHAVGLGALGVVAYYTAFNVGLQTARVTDAAVIQAAIPAVSALLAMPILGERGSRAVWAGIILSTLGVVVLVAGTSTAGEGSLIGDAWMTASTFIWALYSVYARWLARISNDRAITAATLVWGGLLLIPIGLVELRFVTPTPTTEGVLATLFLALFAGALGYWLWSYGLARLEAARASTYLNLLPLVAAISGALVLGERIGVAELTGGLLIVGGVALAARAKPADSTVTTEVPHAVPQARHE